MGIVQSKRRPKDAKGLPLHHGPASASASHIVSSTLPDQNDKQPFPAVRTTPYSTLRATLPNRAPVPSAYFSANAGSRNYALSAPGASTVLNRTNYAGVESNSRFLPKDWDSEDRDLAQHFALQKLFGSNVAQVMTPKFIPAARVVDVGCANGAWIMDMATQYPDCQFTGLDFAHIDTRHHIGALSLPNVQVTVADDAGKMPFEDASVDVVHMRAVNFFFSTADWENALREAYRILKPGGMLQVVELHLALSGTVLIESFIDTVRKILKSTDKDYDIAVKMTSGLETAGFQVIQSQMKKVHLASDGQIGQDFVAVILRYFEHIQSVLAPGMGLDGDDYRQRVEMVCAQCVQQNAHLAWYAYVGKKPTSL